MNVLIVDDNAPMRRMLRDFISNLFDNVFECADGRDALSFYRQHRPDWVLMDVQMPDIDGIAATRAIIADDRRARVVIVTQFDDVLFREQAAEAGACGFVLKENLLEIRRILQQQNG